MKPRRSGGCFCLQFQSLSPAAQSLLAIPWQSKSQPADPFQLHQMHMHHLKSKQPSHLLISTRRFVRLPTRQLNGLARKSLPFNLSPIWFSNDAHVFRILVHGLCAIRRSALRIIEKAAHFARCFSNFSAYLSAQSSHRRN